jgi:hypothetical protein
MTTLKLEYKRQPATNIFLGFQLGLEEKSRKRLASSDDCVYSTDPTPKQTRTTAVC